MIFHEIIGNINEIDDLNGYHVETIYLNSEDMLKRILRVTSDHNREYGITLDNNEKLKDGDILYNEDKKLIVVKANSEDVLIIKPSSITEMGVIAHALGNRHLQAQFEDDKMIIQYDRLVEEELKRDNVKGEVNANDVHFEVGKKIRNTIKELGGTMPEDYPTPEKSLKVLEKENKNKIKISNPLFSYSQTPSTSKR